MRIAAASGAFAALLVCASGGFAGSGSGSTPTAITAP
jgi:hypothetical protein